MKAYALVEPGRMEWIEAPEPVLTEYGAILRPIAVSPCTSDVHTIYGGGQKPANLIMGHECVAVVEDVGCKVKDFKPGDRVAVPAITPDWREPEIQDGNYTHGGAHFAGHRLGRSIPGVFAERFLIDDADTNIAHIPENVTDEQALMCVDVVTTGFTGVEGAVVKFGDVVCVMGIGAVGLMAVLGAKMRGASRIIAVGTRAKSVELAKYYGATDVLSYNDDRLVEKILDMTNGVGVDSTIIAGGNADTLVWAYDITRYGVGNISNVNYFAGKGFLNIPIFSGGRGMCGKTLHMELAKGGRTRIERIMSMVEYNRFDPSPLVTHHLYGIDNIDKAILMMKDKADDLIKVMVHCE